MNSTNGFSSAPKASGIKINGCAVVFGLFVVFAFGFVMGVGAAVLIGAIGG